MSVFAKNSCSSANTLLDTKERKRAKEIAFDCLGCDFIEGMNFSLPVENKSHLPQAIMLFFSRSLFFHWFL
jgi:hypothetical protein